jgi:hypothetical protein
VTLTPAIVKAASAPTVLDAALAYRDMGFSVLPVRGKEPAISWRSLQTRIASVEDILRWDAGYGLQGVGIICGKVSELVVVDLDGDKAIDAFRLKFPGMMETYSVRSGSGHGLHLYYAPTYIPSTTRVVGTPFGNFELRSDGCYVVAPPSIHPSGAPYRIENRAHILAVHDLNPIRDWFLSLMAQKHGGKLPPPANRPDRVSRWALAALDAECAAVRTAPVGARNNTLNRAAFKLGQLVGSGKLRRETVEAHLLEAAAALIDSDGENTVVRTIASGLTAGIQNPRN